MLTLNDKTRILVSIGDEVAFEACIDQDAANNCVPADMPLKRLGLVDFDSVSHIRNFVRTQFGTHISGKIENLTLNQIVDRVLESRRQDKAA